MNILPSLSLSLHFSLTVVLNSYWILYFQTTHDPYGEAKHILAYESLQQLYLDLRVEKVQQTLKKCTHSS